jgi:hypothetical protein
MAVNLSRNTKVFISTNTTDTLGDFTTSNTFEIQVMDGYTFNQNTEQQTITLSEAGTAPVRGERSFNSKLNPVEWSLSTYIRPYLASGVVTAPEKFLWNALMGSAAIDATGVALSAGQRNSATEAQVTTSAQLFADAADAVGQMITIRGIAGNTAYNAEFKVTSVTGTTTQVVKFETDTDLTSTAPTFAGTPKAFKGQWREDASKAITSTIGSNRNSLQSFTLLFKVDNTMYKVASCAVNQADIQFDITGIAMIAWSGFGTTLSTPSLTFVAGTHYTAFPSAADNYITNKLSTTTLVSNISGTAGTTYTVPITGGNLTISNNIEYLTPENMGVVNNAIGYFTGNRSITGALNAYLKTGSNESSTLLADIVAGLATTSETKFKLQIEIGGAASATRVECLMNGCQLQVPTVDIQDVVSTVINFTAQGYSGTDYEISKTNNLVVSYYGVA